MKINSKNELVEQLKNLRALEIEARNRYTEDIESFKDFNIKFTIESIEKDEEDHIKIIDSVLKYLEKK